MHVLAWIHALAHRYPLALLPAKLPEGRGNVDNTVDTRDRLNLGSPVKAVSQKSSASTCYLIMMPMLCNRMDPLPRQRSQHEQDEACCAEDAVGLIREFFVLLVTTPDSAAFRSRAPLCVG